MPLVRLVALAAVGLILAACASSVTSTPVPTEFLIPSTPTHTPTPITPTPAQPTAVSPQELQFTATVAAQSNTQLVLNAVITDLAAYLETPSDQIRLLDLDVVVWTSPTLNCNEGRRPLISVQTEGYRLLLEANGEMYHYHTNSIGTDIRRCTEREANIEGTSALVEVDPLAAELAALGQRRISGELELPVRRVRVLDVVALTWEDSSLGCPISGQTYIRLPIIGYRIVLSAGDNQYVFHTDSERLILCEPENEALPTPEVMPEATP